MGSCFVIQSIDGKGLGVIATRSLDKGELVISEKPLFTQPRSRNAGSIANALSKVSVNEKREYLSLANCHPRGKVNPLLGIFNTNAWPCGATIGFGSEKATEAGIFLQCSRFNSSCSRNVSNFWNEKAGVLEMRATKNINAGDELCPCYIGEWLPRAERRRKLKNRFNFVCNCSTCSLEPPEQIESDRRRMELQNLYDEIGTCMSNPTLGIQKVKKALKLLQEEGITQNEAAFCYDAFQFCAHVANRERAKEWATKAWNSACLANGDQCDEATRYARFIKDPSTHAAWGLSRDKRTHLPRPDF